MPTWLAYNAGHDQIHAVYWRSKLAMCPAEGERHAKLSAVVHGS